MTYLHGRGASLLLTRTSDAIIGAGSPFARQRCRFAATPGKSPSVTDRLVYLIKVPLVLLAAASPTVNQARATEAYSLSRTLRDRGGSGGEKGDSAVKRGAGERSRDDTHPGREKLQRR